MSFKKEFSLVGETDQEGSAVVLEHLWADVYGIKIKKTDQLTFVEQWEIALRLALREAEARSARQVLFRLIDADKLSELGAKLPALGFRKKHDRAEFRRPVGELPSDVGTPMTWRAAGELRWRDVDLANLIARVSVGDPDHDASEDPLTFIQDMLADPFLTSGLDCFHIGFLDGKIAAITVVQISPKSGWSRISYMGMLPEFRRQRLGQWVHRHSFKIMQEQGGQLYHGGTVATNWPMIRLFELHGCERFREMEEWVCVFSGCDQ